MNSILYRSPVPLSLYMLLLPCPPHPFICRQWLIQLLCDSAATKRLSGNKQMQKNQTKKKSQTMLLSVPAPLGTGSVPHVNSAHLFANVHRHQFPAVSEEDPRSFRGGERKTPEAARGHHVQCLLPALLPSHLPPELAQEG